LSTPPRMASAVRSKRMGKALSLVLENQSVPGVSTFQSCHVCPPVHCVAGDNRRSCNVNPLLAIYLPCNLREVPKRFPRRPGQKKEGLTSFDVNPCV
jgi:hypothetical protein